MRDLIGLERPPGLQFFAYPPGPGEMFARIDKHRQQGLFQAGDHLFVQAAVMCRRRLLEAIVDRVGDVLQAQIGGDVNLQEAASPLSGPTWKPLPDSREVLA